MFNGCDGTGEVRLRRGAPAGGAKKLGTGVHPAKVKFQLSLNMIEQKVSPQPPNNRVELSDGSAAKIIDAS